MCIVCWNTRMKDESVSMHCFPQDKAKRQQWFEALGLQEVVIKDHHCVCSHYVPNADVRNDPQTICVTKEAVGPKGLKSQGMQQQLFNPFLVVAGHQHRVNNWCSFPRALCFLDSALCIPGKSNMLRASSYFQPKNTWLLFYKLSLSAGQWKLYITT